MSVSLEGVILSDCDTAGDFSTRNGGANINATDDDFVEGTGGVGDKMSNTTELLVSDNLGSPGTFDFSSGGTHEGWHFIGWVNIKTPFDATDGMAVYFRNAAGHFGTWNVMPSYFYKGGFTTRVISPVEDFNAATTWTTTGNPAQLDDVTEMGFQVHTTSSIMGSFNNVQVDIFTGGLGLRSAGAASPGDTWATVTAADLAAFYGWWTDVNGIITGKGGLYIGPSTGSASHYFSDSSFSVNFADENVASDFYQINIRGAGTTVHWTLGNISAGGTPRWDLTLSSDVLEFTDDNGVWGHAGTLTLNDASVLTGTTIVDATSLVQNQGTLTGITVIEANTASNTAFVTSDDPTLITDSTFNQGAGGGHALELPSTIVGSSPFAFALTDVIFTGYSGTPGTNLVVSSGSSDAAIYNNTGEHVTLNISGGTTPAIRNGAGSTTTVNATVTFSLTNVISGTTLYVISLDAGSPDTELVAPTTVTADPHNESLPANTDFRAVLALASDSPYYEPIIFDDNTGSGFSRRIEQGLDS